VSVSGSGVGGNITFSFPTFVGHDYYLEYKTNLTDAAWITLSGPLPGNALTQTFNNTIGSDKSRFYRLRIQ
jgi:hypothetical protein